MNRFFSVALSFVAVCVAFFVVVLFLVGCGRSDEKAYRSYKWSVPVEKSGAFFVKKLQGFAVANNTTDVYFAIQSAASLNQLKWTVPPSWKEDTASGVQFSNFLSEKTDLNITLVSFPGDVGGLRSNILRWIRQLNLESFPSEDEITTYISSLKASQTSSGFPFLFIDLRGFTKDLEQTTLVGIFRFSDDTLFVKISGFPDKISADEEDFRKFLSSFRLE